MIKLILLMMLINSSTSINDKYWQDYFRGIISVEELDAIYMHDLYHNRTNSTN